MSLNMTLILSKSVANLRGASWFPYQSGNLKYSAMYVKLYDAKTGGVAFDESIAPYINFLEFGTSPHDIPNAFGFGQGFGTGGRFNGKFHPGSTKHVGFISVKSANEICKTITSIYGGYTK